jgi:hypothetical protein
MKLSKIALAVFTTASCLVPLAPAHAGPLDQYGGSILDPNSSILAKDPRALCSDVIRDDIDESSMKAESARQHQEKSVDTWDNGNTWDRGNTSDKNSKKSSQKGASFMGIGANMSDSSEDSHKSSAYDKGTVYDKGSDTDESSDSNSGKYETHTKTTRAKTAGKNCDAFVTASATRDAAAYGADAQVKMTEIATKGKLEAVKVESNAKFMESLMKW